MSRLRADEVLNKAANGPFLATEGINIPGGKNIFFNDLSETTILDGTSLTTTDITTTTLNSSGSTTITGTLSINTSGTLETTDITASTLTVTGDSTFQGNVNLGDNDSLYFGDGNDLRIFSGGNNVFIQETSSTGSLFIDSTNLVLRNGSGDETHARFLTNGAVELYYDNSKKFETTTTGVAVSGVTTSTGGWAGTTSSADVLGGLAMSFTCGMNGRIQIPSINSTMLFGGSEYNGDNSEGITMPHDGKIYTATIFAEKVTGSAAIQAQINGTRDSSYGFNISGSNQTNVSQIQTWYESPLSFSAGDRINFSFETANITYLEVLTICFFVKFD